MLTEQQRRELDWEKTDGLMPVIVQHAVSGEVLMLGYMNPEALDKTIESGKVTFFSRTKQRLWTKGETSGQFPQRSKYCAGLRQRHATGTGESYRTNLP
ncbi:histidine biosynthesis bifunctional protein [includes phosphoribosyl-AMP cyclohydrolase;phosphoribosyl-ATP pyrophosphatase] [Escherichia coli]|uniref:Histidine biosynthesis bifunctional protein HisIE n=1 Tax=Escherichia coli TaxID=562 RepID=A0A377BR03_ECOLX|nr:histidine biosynthesis bifunctional protein [includes phosphoribosyl-AMP cyclohydrolase;phosphoribosyl-ATP pyrophosphatase] [Escherichia coli]